jgi:hypothetical protein
MKEGSVLAFSHVCDVNFCHPKNVRENVYVCVYGAVHTCSADGCDLASITERGEWVCPLSGAVFGVDAEEPAMFRTDDGQLVPLGWKMVKEKGSNKKRKHEDVVIEPIEQRARIVMEALFFGRARLVINRAHDTRQRERHQQLQHRYAQEQQRDNRFISVPHVYCISANTIGKDQKKNPRNTTAARGGGVPYAFLNFILTFKESRLLTRYWTKTTKRQKNA